jgi:hypothetical protein
MPYLQVGELWTIVVLYVLLIVLWPGRWGSPAPHEREAGGHQRPKSQNRYGQ